MPTREHDDYGKRHPQSGTEHRTSSRLPHTSPPCSKWFRIEFPEKTTGGRTWQRWSLPRWKERIASVLSAEWTSRHFWQSFLDWERKQRRPARTRGTRLEHVRRDGSKLERAVDRSPPAGHLLEFVCWDTTVTIYTSGTLFQMSYMLWEISPIFSHQSMTNLIKKQRHR
jgi:hypothetical protein